MRTSPRLAGLFVGASAVLLARTALAIISSENAAVENGGGCYPTSYYGSITDQLTLINPEWAPVTNGSSVRFEPCR